MKDFVVHLVENESVLWAAKPNQTVAELSLTIDLNRALKCPII